jgi:hypothetical protein
MFNYKMVNSKKSKFTETKILKAIKGHEADEKQACP